MFQCWKGPRVGVGNLDGRLRFEVKVYFLNFDSERVRVSQTVRSLKPWNESVL